MEILLKLFSCLMIIVLVVTQLLLNSPYRANLTDDSVNGRIIKTYETIMYKGTVMLDALGDYVPNSATLLVNAEPYKTVDSFPVDIEICDGDVVEIMVKMGSRPFYVLLVSRKGEAVPDLDESTVAVHEGINYLFKCKANPGKN